MKHIYQQHLKPFIRNQILLTVQEKHLTNDKASEILGIDPRTYAYLAAGKYMCSAPTLLMFLVKLCPDPARFIKEAREYIERIEKQQ